MGYIITASTLNKARYLSTDDRLQLWVNMLQELTEKFGVALRAWVVLRNHYHLLLKSHIGRDVGSVHAKVVAGTMQRMDNG